MTDLSNLSIAELGALICESLKEKGVKVTLSGGACAEIYSSNKYVTGDLDFVVNYVWSQNNQIIEQVMSAFGFEKQGRIYTHKKIAYAIEFPPGPLGIGDEYQIKPILKKFATGTLSMLSSTDSAKDRLAGYFYANDAQCLEQAIMICQMNSVDMDNIRSWARKEGQEEKFKEFERRI
jgi:hypothetical protein